MKKKYVIGLHILVWSLFFMEGVFTLIDIPQIQPPQWIHLSRELYIIIVQLHYIVISLVTFYSTVFLILPLIFRKKNYFLAVLSIIGLAIVVVLMRYIIEFLILKPFIGWDNYSRHENFTWAWFVKNCLSYYFRQVLWGIIYFFIVEWYQTTNREKTLEREKTNAELAFLKSQINPHFLFNTINDIYGLALMKSDNTPEALLKLSGMLRYMLHESNTAFVPLEKELNYIKEFIDLQSIGFKGNTQVLVNIEGDISKPTIPPMLLIPFVENAFKHGDFNDKNNPIEIVCRVENEQIIFRCKNIIRPKQKDSVGGIGLQNVKRRLELLYPKRHKLDIDTENGFFNCTLILSKNL
jgi:two-component system, LytTR family, sensor kinase